MKKIIGIIFIILFVLAILLTNEAFAMSIKDLQPATMGVDTSKVTSFAKEVFGVIINVAVISSVVILAYIGLKFMFGSVEQKAEYKKSLMPLLIGVFVVMGATTITSVVWDLEKTCQHRWSGEPTCRLSVQCSLCGATKNGTHKYEGVPYVCKYCGKIP